MPYLCPGEIEQERREQAEVERHMNGLMLDIMKLNGLLGKNSQQSEALEHSNSLMESDFISRLKVRASAFPSTSAR